MEEKERLKKQLDFILEVDKVKNIFRQNFSILQTETGKKMMRNIPGTWH